MRHSLQVTYVSVVNKLYKGKSQWLDHISTSICTSVTKLMSCFWKRNELHEISHTDIQIQLVRNFEAFMQPVSPLLPSLQRIMRQRNPDNTLKPILLHNLRLSSHLSLYLPHVFLYSGLANYLFTNLFFSQVSQLAFLSNGIKTLGENASWWQK